MPSIRRKITFGYYLFAACMIGLAVFAYANLRFLEERLDWSAVASGFLDATLEMRRFEKNFFLYGQPGDAASALSYAGTAYTLLEDNAAVYRKLAAAAEQQPLHEWLERYIDRLTRLMRERNLDVSARDLIEQEIRELGHELSTSAERISAKEHQAMRELLNLARTTLVGLLIAITLFSLVLAHVLTRIVVQPLRRLEQDLQDIGRGGVDSLPMRSGESEIVSFTRAFNHTLHELELRRRHLLQSEKLASLGTLVSGVAHELNNPLSNISTSTQLLVEELTSADPDLVRAWLGDIEEQTERARRIVSSLLAFSRDSPFTFQATSVRDVIEKSVILLSAQIPGECTIQIDVAPGSTIEADAQKLQQVFVNLLGNAIDAGARRVHVQAPAELDAAAVERYIWTRSPSSIKRGDEALCISVSDDGPGVAEELLPKLFDPFFTTKEVGHGSGLGLYVVVEIVHQHEGCVGVASVPGGGTSFLIRLPRQHSGDAKP
jgi:signal transduction histidine kinase